MEIKFLPEWMIKTLGFLLILFLLFLVLNQINKLKSSSNVMRVSAEGSVVAVPDLATVTVGVTSEGTSPIEVKNKNNQSINQIISFLKRQDIKEEDIKTTAFYASPKYNYTNGQNTLVGYQADQAITFKVRAIDKSQAALEKILDGVVNNGANQVQGINFSFADIDKLKQLARKQAIEKAKEKARELSTEAGVKLGEVVNVSEGESDFAAPRPYAVANFTARAATVKPNIEPGSQEVAETITLMFKVY